MRPTCRFCMHYLATSPGKGRCLWHDISTTPGRQCHLVPRAGRGAFFVSTAGVVVGALERTVRAGRQSFTVPKARFQLELAPARMH
jgi:hypothetical protein